jgi:hypothetical protein
MKVIAIIIVQDESDIFAYVVRKALDYFDQIFVYDTGSVDGTVQIARDFAERDARIRVIWEQSVVFDEFRTRKHALSLFADQLSDGDWVTWLDADEEVGLSPDRFRDLIDKERSDLIRHRHYNFGLVADQVDVAIGEGSKFNPKDFQFYKSWAFTEVKMMRWRASMLAALHGGRNLMFPGAISACRLPILHYPYRSIRQIKRRIETRQLVMSILDPTWNGHWRINQLENLIYQVGDPALLKLHPERVESDFRRRDGLRDSRWSGTTMIVELAKYYLKLIAFRCIGARFCDAIGAKRNPMADPRAYQPIPKSVEMEEALRKQHLLLGGEVIGLNLSQ